MRIRVVRATGDKVRKWLVKLSRPHLQQLIKSGVVPPEGGHGMTVVAVHWRRPASGTSSGGCRPRLGAVPVGLYKQSDASRHHQALEEAGAL